MRFYFKYGWLLALALEATARADEVLEADLRTDAHSQLARIKRTLAEIRDRASEAADTVPLSPATPFIAGTGDHLGAEPAVRPLAPPAEILGIEPGVGEVRPLRPGGDFNPRTFSNLSNLESTLDQLGRREGIAGSGRVKFGGGGHLSLETIGRNNAEAKEVARETAGRPDGEYVQLDSLRSFEERLRDLALRRGPYTLQDYLAFRDFIGEFETVLAESRDGEIMEAFRRNAEAAYANEQSGEKDLNAAATAYRRYLGIDSRGNPN